MSYSIIYETKIVKLSDGRVIHFDLSGCNNDTSGRNRGDFSASLYTVEDFIQMAEEYKNRSRPYRINDGDDWQMKIGKRCCNLCDYGEHLLRMLKRAKSYQDFISSRDISIEILTGFDITKPIEKIVTPEEFDDLFYKYAYNGGITYRELLESVDVRNEQNIIEALGNKKPLRIYIDRPYKT